jgi:hypothetical protein
MSRQTHRNFVEELLSPVTRARIESLRMQIDGARSLRLESERRWSIQLWERSVSPHPGLQVRPRRRAYLGWVLAERYPRHL